MHVYIIYCYCSFAESRQRAHMVSARRLTCDEMEGLLSLVSVCSRDHDRGESVCLRCNILTSRMAV
jgi:hypothetical protein